MKLLSLQSSLAYKNVKIDSDTQFSHKSSPWITKGPPRDKIILEDPKNPMFHQCGGFCISSKNNVSRISVKEKQTNKNLRNKSLS